MNDKQNIGEECICMCGKKGEYCIEPYYEEVHNTAIVVCLCSECYYESQMDI